MAYRTVRAAGRRHSCARNFFGRIKSRFARPEPPLIDDHDVIAFVNEARSDSERWRIARAASARARVR